MNIRTILGMGSVAVSLALAGCGGGGGTDNPVTPPSGNAPIQGRYLMAFHTCQPSACSNPQNHSTWLAQSDDGIAWQPVPGYTPHNGSVPDVIRRDNTLYIFNPNRVRRYDFSTQRWSDPLPVTLTTASGQNELFVDPSLTLDEQGRLVMFYLVGQMGSDPAQCAPGQSPCTKVFRSATEVAGSDGTAFTVDAGDRLTVELQAGEIASDPDIFKAPVAGQVLYISRGMGTAAYTSSTLRGTYSAAGKGLLTQAGGVPAGHYDSTSGRYWTYVHSNQADGLQVIRRTTHAGLDTAIDSSSFTTVIGSGSYPSLGSGVSAASPSFTVNLARP